MANALACAGLGAWLLARTIRHTALQAVAALGTALIGLWYLPRVDGGWAALAMIVVAAWLILRRERPRLPGHALRSTGGQ